MELIGLASERLAYMCAHNRADSGRSGRFSLLATRAPNPAFWHRWLNSYLLTPRLYFPEDYGVRIQSRPRAAHMPESHVANYIVRWYLWWDLQYYYAALRLVSKARPTQLVWYRINFSMAHSTARLLFQEKFSCFHVRYPALLFVVPQAKIMLYK